MRLGTGEGREGGGGRWWGGGGEKSRGQFIGRVKQGEVSRVE